MRRLMALDSLACFRGSVLVGACFCSWVLSCYKLFSQVNVTYLYSYYVPYLLSIQRQALVLRDFIMRAGLHRTKKLFCQDGPAGWPDSGLIFKSTFSRWASWLAMGQLAGLTPA